jgi:diacylglycerol kinase family enzyme
VLYIRGRDFLVETSPARRVQADGELLGHGAWRVRVEPRAARLLVPAGRTRLRAASASRLPPPPVH